MAPGPEPTIGRSQLTVSNSAHTVSALFGERQGGRGDRRAPASPRYPSLALMTKAELIEKIARSKDLPPNVTKKCIAAILDIAFEELAVYFTRARVTRSSSPRFSFPGFGTFTKKKRSARRGVNPRTLEPMKIEACHTLDFKPAAALKTAMNEPAAARKRRTDAKPAKKAAKKTNNRRRLRTREEVELEDLEPMLPDAPLRRSDSKPKSRGKSRTRKSGATSG